MNKPRIVFMGTPEFSSYILEQLISNEYNIVAVVTQPDKPVGRKQELKYSEVKEIALKHNVDVYQPKRIKEEYQFLNELKPDYLVTAAYGQIVPQEVLDIPFKMAINVHGSLLPKYRGGAPIHYAILNGEEKTGITIMEMILEMDAGDILTQSEVDILEEDNLLTVYNKLKGSGAELLMETIGKLEKNEIVPIKQDENLVTYSPPIKREEELIDFNDTCKNIHNKIRAFNPFPTSYFLYNNKRFKVYKSKYKVCYHQEEVGIVKSTDGSIAIYCQDGIIEILELQPSGKKRMEVSQYVNGNSEIIKNGRCN